MNIPISFSIAILYPLFCTNLANHITNYKEVKAMCDDSNGWDSYDSGGFGVSVMNESNMKKNQACRDERDKLLKPIEFKNHCLLLAFGIAAVCGSMMLESGATQTGLGFGGVIVIIIGIFSQWHIYKENTKLMISGAGLLSVMYFSSFIMNTKQPDLS